MRHYFIDKALHAAFALARANVGLIHTLMVLRDRRSNGALAPLRPQYR